MRNVEVAIVIDVAPEKVIEAFMNKDILAAWWDVERSFIEPQDGGAFILLWGISLSGIKYISSGIIASYMPANRLHIEKYMYISPDRPVLGPLALTLDVVLMENGSRLHLSQGPYPENAGPDWDWYYTAVLHAWPPVLERLKKYLENV